MSNLQASNLDWMVVHPLTSSDRDTVSAMRKEAAPFKGQLRGTAARPFFEHAMEQVLMPEMDYQEDVVGGVAGWWCLPKNPLRGRVLLYLHGGGYVLGSAKSFRGLAGHIAMRTQIATFLPEYRLAPENPFPAATYDAKDAYDGLASRGYRAIALVGDSAGGGLAMSLLGRLVRDARHREVLLPAGLVAYSPWTDLSLSSESWATRTDEEHYFVRDQLEEFASLYLNGASSSVAEASPLFSDLHGLPPLQIHVGDAEVLLDDSLRYAEKAVSAGVRVMLNVWTGMPHVFPSAFSRLQASRSALELSATFLADLLKDHFDYQNSPHRDDLRRQG